MVAKKKNVICLFQRQAVWEILGGRGGSVLAFRENQGTEVSMAVILDVGMRYFVPEEHLALYGDIFDCQDCRRACY